MSAKVFSSEEREALLEKRPSASITGAGEIGPGDYGRVRILGAGDVTGDVRAEKLRVYGEGTLRGDLTAANVKVIGALKIPRDLKAGKLTAIGTCEVGGRILAEDFRVLGALEGSGGVEAGSFLARGVVTVRGLLSGDTVEIHMGSGSRSCVGEIGGGRVEVWQFSFGKRSPLAKALGWLSSRVSKSYLRATSIEADDITLENTCAKVVRGKRVEIRSGCTIDEVEYSESLMVHPKARVETRAKL